MRAVFVALTVLFIGVAAVLGVGWATFEHEIVLRQRAGVEWTCLAQMADTLDSGHRPFNSDAAIFLSDRAIGTALKQLEGATMAPPAEKYGGLNVRIKDLGLRPAVGVTGVGMQLEISSARRGLTIDIAADANLAFRGVRTELGSDGQRTAVADFALSILSAEPRLRWGFLDIGGRRFVSELVSSGAMLALDKNLVVSVPFEDRLALDTSVDTTNVVPTDAGSVTIRTTMQGGRLEQRFAVGAPLFLRSGVWLLASADEQGQSAVPVPRLPNVPAAELGARVASLRTELAGKTQDLEQTRDLVLWVRGTGLVGLVDKLKALPPENRTLTIQSTDTTGQLASDGKSYAELSNPGAATAHVAIAPPSAQWIPNKGVQVALDARADLAASVHLHANPLPVGGGFGTTVGLLGNAGARATGTLALTHGTIVGHSVLLLGLEMPCNSMEVELRTDAKLIAGPLKTDMPSVGVRWSIPMPTSIGQPAVLLYDTPRRISLRLPVANKDSWTIATTRPAVAFATHVSDVTATSDGYIVAADLDMQPADSIQATPAESAERVAIAKALADSGRAAAVSCTSEQHIRVLIGGLEIGPNGFVWKTLYNALNDLTHGPGPNNEVVKALRNAEHDVTQGPGPNNELVKAGRNAVHDLTQGPGPNNEVVKVLRSINPFH